jgi:hypothetical protein
MQLSRGRWALIGLLVLSVVVIGHGRLLVSDALGLQRQYIDALALSFAAPTFVLFSALGAPPFKFDRYTRDRGRTGLAIDTALIVAVCLTLSAGVATALLTAGVGTTLSAALLAFVVYATAFAVFTARASDHYRRRSA